jgi:outer membrane protein OmpA-like peptidoglycan-associated protein
LFITTISAYSYSKRKPGVVAFVTTVYGRLEARPYRAKRWQLFKSGTSLHEGDELHTPKASKAIITFIDGVIVKMNEKTRFRISLQDRHSTIRDSIELKHGEIFAEIMKKGLKFKATTNDTTFITTYAKCNIKYTKDQKVGVVVMKGSVDVINAYGNYIIPENNKLTILQGKILAMPQPIKKSDVPKWEKAVVIKNDIANDLQKITQKAVSLNASNILEELSNENGVIIMEENKHISKQNNNSAKNKEAIKKINLKNKLTIITTESAVKFDFDSSKIAANDFKLLTKIAALLKEFPDRKIRIEGHTDNIGDADYNLKLSKSRAEIVKKYFMEIEDLSHERIITKGLGDKNPLFPNNSNDGRTQNRRVEIILE